MIEFFYRILSNFGYNHPIHPTLTHLPIGMTMGAFLFMLGGLVFRKTSLVQTARHCAILALLGVLIVGGAVGVFFYFTGQQGDKTLAPSSLVTSAPTPDSSGVNLWEDVLLVIGSKIARNDTDGANPWDDPSTPQYAALNWIAREDPYTVQLFLQFPSLAPEVLERVLLERYVIAELYFATNGQASWKSDWNFLEPYSVCNWNSNFDNPGGSTTMGIYCNEVVGEGGEETSRSVTMIRLGT